MLTGAKEFSFFPSGEILRLEGRRGALGCHFCSSPKFPLAQTQEARTWRNQRKVDAIGVDQANKLELLQKDCVIPICPRCTLSLESVSCRFDQTTNYQHQKRGEPEVSIRCEYVLRTSQGKRITFLCKYIHQLCDWSPPVPLHWVCMARLGWLL